MPEEAGFCAKCGKEQPKAAEVPEAPRPRKTAPRWLPVAALVLVGAVIAAYFLLSHRTPRQLLALANVKFASAAAEELDLGVSGPWGLQSRMQSEPSTSKVTISGRLSSKERNPDIQLVQQFLDKSSIMLTSKNDPKADKQWYDLKLNLRGSELLSGEFYRSPEQLAAKVPVIYDKHMLLENHDIGSVMAKLDIPWEGPDKFPSQTETMKNLKLEQLMPVLMEYGRFLNTSVKDDEITMESGVDYQSPDGTVSLRQITLNLSEARIKEILKGLSQKLRDDEAGLDKIAESIAGFAEMAATGAAANDPELKRWQDKSYVKQQIRDGSRDGWDKAVDDLLFPEGLTVTLLVDKGGNLVHERIRFAMAPREYPEDLVFTDVYLSHWKGKNGNDLKILVDAGSGTGKNASSVRFDLKSHKEPTAGKEERSKTTVDIISQNYGYTDAVRIDMNTTVTRGAERGKDRYVTDATIKIGAGTSGGTISAKLNTLRSNSTGGSHYENTTELTLDIAGDGVPGINVGVKTETAVDFGKIDAFPAFSDTTAINLNTASQSDIDRLRMDLQKGVQRFLNSNMSLFMSGF
jgi:hypothetical protein